MTSAAWSTPITRTWSAVRPSGPRAARSGPAWTSCCEARLAAADGSSPKRPQHWRGGVNLWTLLIGSNHAVAAPPGAMMRVRPFSRYAIP
ncbi:MAG: hypothetical protein QOF29_3334 [bacterium]